MRKQEQVLTVIALVLLAGIILYNALTVPNSGSTGAEEGSAAETVAVVTEPASVSSFSVSETTASTTVPVTESEPETGSAPSTEAPGISTDGKVNINTGSLEDLETLTGIGPSKAQAIIDYRTQNGPFQSISDITNVSGIGEKTFLQIQDSITV